MPFQACETLSSKRLCRVQKVDKHSRNSHKLQFCINYIVNSSCLICSLNPHFAQKLFRKVKVAQGCKKSKKLQQTPKVAQTLPNTIETDLAAWTNCFQVSVQEKQANALFKFCSALWPKEMKVPSPKLQHITRSYTL